MYFCKVNVMLFKTNTPHSAPTPPPILPPLKQSNSLRLSRPIYRTVVNKQYLLNSGVYFPCLKTNQHPLQQLL